MNLLVNKKNLRKISEFDSGPDSLGTDYYVVYEIKSKPDFIVINCSGVAVGWEFDRWEAAQMEGKNSLIFEKLMRAKGDREKCMLIQEMDFISVGIEE